MTRVVAGVIQKNRKVLIAKRKRGGPFGGMWEFPGGKIEPGETPEESLRRELFEEFGIEAETEGLVSTNVHSYDSMTVELSVYRVSWKRGKLIVKVHDEARWVPIRELKDYDFLPADIPAIKIIEEEVF